MPVLFWFRCGGFGFVLAGVDERAGSHRVEIKGSVWGGGGTWTRFSLSCCSACSSSSRSFSFCSRCATAARPSAALSAAAAASLTACPASPAAARASATAFLRCRDAVKSVVSCPDLHPRYPKSPGKQPLPRTRPTMLRSCGLPAVCLTPCAAGCSCVGVSHDPILLDMA